MCREVALQEENAAYKKAISECKQNIQEKQMEATQLLSNLEKLKLLFVIWDQACGWANPQWTSVLKGVSSSSYLCQSTCLKPDCKHGCACWEDEYVKAVISYGQDDLADEEIGVALPEVMHTYDDDKGSCLYEDSTEDVNNDPISN